MSEVERQEHLSIFQLADKPYEHRSPSQHNLMTDFLAFLFPTVSQKMARLMSFYLQRFQGPSTLTNKQFSSQSFVITASQNEPENPETSYSFRVHNLSKDRKVVLQQGQQALVLDYTHYLNCQAFGQSSIEEEINFMHSSEFLCSIPKRRLYHILRKSVALAFSIFQTVYQEGQQIQAGESGSGVYLVRRGDFGYFKFCEREGKQIETLGFSKGHLFGTIELSSKPPLTNRQFTVRCKSHSGLVYRFSEDIYATQIKPYCENVINNRQSKLSKYIEGQVDKSEKMRQTKGPFLSQTLTRGFSLTNHPMGKTQMQEFPLLTRTRLSIPNVETSPTKPLLSQRLQQQGLRKTNYLSLTKEGPLKVYPMISQRSNYTESEFRQFDRLERNKEMCEKVKELKARGKCTAAKGEILFSFFKQTWNFNKERKMMLTNRRYA